MNKIKNVYNKNYIIFLCLGYLPIVWKVCQTAFLSTFENALKIMGQVALLSIIFKCLQETLINPLFKILGQNDNAEEERLVFARKFFLTFACIVCVFTTVVFFLLQPIMKISHVPNEIFDSTLVFLKIMAFTQGLQILVQYLFTFHSISKNTKQLFYYLLINCLVNLVLLIALVPKFTLGLGANGVAIATLIVNVGLLIYLFLTLPKVKANKTLKFNIKKYSTLTVFSFLETIVRNVVYYFVILVFLNIVNNQDVYYVVNDFIWSFMLVPVLAQNNCIKQEVSINNKISLKPYFLNNIIILLYMVMLIPIAYVLFNYVYCLENAMLYFTTLLQMLPCYFVFVFDNVIESYFIASGKLHHVFMQTFLTNICVYVTAYILYVVGVWQITLSSIIALFSAGMIVSSLYTIIVFLCLKKIEKNNQNKRENLATDC